MTISYRQSSLNGRGNEYEIIDEEDHEEGNPEQFRALSGDPFDRGARVGLFAGLMVSTPDMIRAGGDYMNENDLYDVRLVSTLGFDRDAVNRLEEIDGLKAVEGSVSSDFLAVDESGEELVLTAQTLLDVQNQVVLVSGRLPETGRECAVDAEAFPEEAIGRP